MKNKVLSLLLTVVMTLTMVTTMPFNFQSVAQGNATKENSDSEVLVKPEIQSEIITAEQVEFNSEPVEASQPVNGTGDYSDPYQLTTAAELLWFANTVNNGNMYIHAKLMTDIDLSSVCSPELGSWKPISSNYSGSFDGNRHVIKNLYINSTEDDQGLFGEIDRATINNLGLVNCNITGADYVGGLVGNSGYANVNNCFVTGSVTGNENVGGIYGFCSCSYPTDDISAAKVSGNTNVGVICGTFGGAFSHSVGIKTENVPLFGNMLSYAEIDNVVEMDDLSTGEACYFMNGNSGVFPTWYQNTGVGGDEFPVLDSTHGIVYKTDDGYSMCKDHSSMTDGF